MKSTQKPTIRVQKFLTFSRNVVLHNWLWQLPLQVPSKPQRVAHLPSHEVLFFSTYLSNLLYGV